MGPDKPISGKIFLETKKERREGKADKGNGPFVSHLPSPSALLPPSDQAL
jgi:hypothetical protein